ncbi:MAG: prefoldin subunit alpha [Candidatus Hydrothermarchaeales archaeon]
MSAKKSVAKKAQEGTATVESILAEYEGLRAQTEVLRESLNLINSSLGELNVVRDSLGKIGEMSEDNEILVPMGADSFTKATITDRERVIVGIGSNVAVGKSISEALEDLEKRVKDLEKLRGERTSDLQQSAKKMEELSPTVQAILAKMTKEG